MYCNPRWPLVVQRVKHLRTWHAKSPMNTNAYIVLHERLQFKLAIDDLKLSRRVLVDTHVFTKPSPFEKEAYLS